LSAPAIRASIAGRNCREARMTRVTYAVVEHDGGWAYKVGDTFSETYPSREAARLAALHAAQEQQVPGEPATISWEDERGRWHAELSRGGDRPEVDVED
jgi:hypothetical protein